MNISKGHLCIIPTIPMVHSSPWKIVGQNLMVNWSRNTTEKEKIEEGKECIRMYKNILNSLNKYY